MLARETTPQNTIPWLRDTDTPSLKRHKKDTPFAPPHASNRSADIHPIITVLRLCFLLREGKTYAALP